MNKPIWADWPDGWHTTCFEGLSVRFKVKRINLCEMDMYEIDGAMENTTPPANPKRFQQLVPDKDVAAIKLFETPLDMFKRMVEIIIRRELPEKVPCLNLAPDYLAMYMRPDEDGFIRGYCELAKGHEGPHRRGRHEWETGD